jgi:hypothetical protein
VSKLLLQGASGVGRDRVFVLKSRPFHNSARSSLSCGVYR